MSFRDPLDPIWLAFGPELQSNERDLRSDFPFDRYPTHKPGWRSVLRSAARGIALLAGATIVLTVLLFLPVLIGELASVEAVEMQGQNLSVTEFVAKLKNMLFGTFIVALSLICFLASAAFASQQQGVRVADVKPITRKPRSIPLAMASSLVEVRNV